MPITIFSLYITQIRYEYCVSKRLSYLDDITNVDLPERTVQRADQAYINLTGKSQTYTNRYIVYD
jgi:hypothetical protein